MRKHGWQLPYHPLQVVAVAVFLALGFAYYVFFAPFVGKQLFQYIAMGIYTPLIICAFALYIWCAAADPADPGVFKSKKYRSIQDNKNHVKQSGSKHGGESISSIQDANTVAIGEESNDKRKHDIESAADCNTEPEKNNSLFHQRSCSMAMLALLPCAYVCNSQKESSDQHTSEDGMFYCNLCEVEVWLCMFLNTASTVEFAISVSIALTIIAGYITIYMAKQLCRQEELPEVFHTDGVRPSPGMLNHALFLFVILLTKTFSYFITWFIHGFCTLDLRLQLIIQWSTGILVLVLCFLEKKRFATNISSKLGSSFTVVPFIIVVVVCTILAMIATLPLAQLFFFHILLIKKGISTYDYIIALREQEQHASGSHQSPQMSPVSSVTRLSSASSFNTFHRAAWCTPPRLFVEDQYDVVPPDNISVSSLGKKKMGDEPTKKKNPAPVKISPWALARLNAEDVSKAAAEARKKSKILRPVVRRDSTYALETDSSGRKMALRPDNNRKRGSNRIRLPAETPLDHRMITETSSSLAPLQLEARSDFRAMAGIVASSSPESSSIDSPDIHPLSRVEEGRRRLVNEKEIALSRSTSDGGYDASGGEDSDRVVPTRILHRSDNWSSLLFGTNVPEPSSSTLSNHRKL
ncbi:hypothetical protein RD792_012480 [Penstemon davidsonii]|uniref:S-acyltransferase n=1 Tax=Penstemon davidsonii TaxID=160366 RepID=A0ABR0CWZ1_9LAMI|nr:hypothetical protein RD792_012480 [Penstemon davidsonii]